MNPSPRFEQHVAIRRAVSARLVVATSAIQPAMTSVTSTGDRDRWRRLSAVMRFLAHLQEIGDEPDIIDAVIQAAAIWYDLDARAYVRRPDGRFTLAAGLPGSETDGPATELNGTIADRHPTPGWISSISELEQLGWKSMREDVFLLPVSRLGGGGAPVHWLLLLSGMPEDRTLRDEIESTLLVIGRVLGMLLDARAARLAQAVESRLAQRIARGAESNQALARALLEETVREVGATEALLRLSSGPGMAFRVVATVSGGLGTEPPPGEPAGVRLARAQPLVGGAECVLELLIPEPACYTLEQAHAADAAARSLAIWLSGVAAGIRKVAPDWAGTFEARVHEEVERAKRFDLQLGLVVLDSATRGAPLDARALATLTRMVRAQLRASDLVGRLATGEVGALLVHTGQGGIAAAAGRMRRAVRDAWRSHALPPVIVGQAVFPAEGESAAALIAKARDEAERQAGSPE